LRFILTPHYFRLVNQSFMRRLRDSLAQIPESENQFTHFILKYQMRRNALMPHQLFAAKVESVTPAVDADFMAYILSIPQSLKHNYKFYVDMIKKHFPLLAKAPVSSGGYAFHFHSAELEREEPTLLDDLKLRLTRALLLLKVSLTTRLSRGHAFKKLMLPSRLSRLPPEVVVQVLEYKNFDRPFYNKRLLRRLFRAYRNGVVVYHNLFGLVFYIELWHLLFVDEDSPALFNPKSFGLSELSKERKPS
jgi:hypothetical protein